MRSLIVVILPAVLSAGGGEAGSAPAPDAADSLIGPGSDSTGQPSSARSADPFLAMGASAVIPGLGQVASGRYIRGGLFSATEVTMGLVARDRYVNSIEHFEREQDLADSIPTFRRLENQYEDSARSYVEWFRIPIDSTEKRSADSSSYARFSLQSREARDRRLYVESERDLARFDKRESRVEMGNALWMMFGVHLFNVMDALSGTGAWQDDKPRSPKTAGLLSAVPALGLGQMYNGAYAKAGMVFMVQSSLGCMAYNFHGLMRRSERALTRLENPDRPEYAIRGDFVDSWESRRNESFRKRNTYLWYSLLFYFYGLFDAVVDAHLHDVSRQMKLEPDLIVREDRLGLGVSLDL